jgi:hypothetical protein
VGVGGKAPGADKLLYAWICVAGVLICCLPVPLVGLYFANEAKKEGNPQAQTALLLNGIAAGLTFVGWILIFLSSLAGSGSSA